MCCVCDGSCCHVGPHSYCAEHSPQRQVTPLDQYWWWQYVTAPARPCNPHCYCQNDPVHLDHYLCCMCLNRMHRKFVDGPCEEKLS